MVLLIKYENFYFFWFDVPVFLYSLSVGFYLISRFIFASVYGLPIPMAQEALPDVTIVIPAFNEEHHIERTLTHAMEVAYPADSFGDCRGRRQQRPHLGGDAAGAGRISGVDRGGVRGE